MSIETHELPKNHTLEIWYDDDTHESVRGDCLGTFFGFHKRYRSPDAAPDSDPETAARIANRSQNICLPVWLYAHSGTCYRAAESNPFHCPWDSGLFGFIYVSKESARRELGVKRLTADRIEKIKTILKMEVSTYSSWANGEVYGWEILDGSSGEVVESCGGYVGDIDGARQDGIDAAKALV